MSKIEGLGEDLVIFIKVLGDVFAAVLHDEAGMF